MTQQPAAREQLLERLLPACEGIGADVLHDFVSRMDPDYFERFTITEMARHLALVDRLDLDHPCQMLVTDRPDNRFEIVIVSYDYFSEFATICGLLSAVGLNIEEGRIYTFGDATPVSSAGAATLFGVRRRPKTRPGLSRKKIVDLFRVRPVEGTAFTAADQQRLGEDLTRMVQLLDAGEFEEARHQVNRQLVERLGKQRTAFRGLLQPVQITFDNDQSPTDTVMDIRSDDTPAFLYAFGNALAMRNVYIAKAQFENIGTKLHDRFFVRNRYGQKLVDPQDQQQLRLTAALIKQFTHALTWAPDPAKALESFDQFLDLIVVNPKSTQAQQALDFVRDKKSLPLLAQLLGASDFLWEDFLRRQHVNLLPMLHNFRDAPLVKPRATLRKELDRQIERAKTDEAKKAALNRLKDQELFRIDMKHLLDPATNLPDFSLALTELAEVVLDRTVSDCQASLERHYGTPRLAGRRPCPFTVLGLGKFGGRELGYASDIELLFVYGGPGKTGGKQPIENSEYFERLVQALLQWIEAKQEGIFHLDVRLRPHGGKGSLANPLEEIRTYYSPSGLSAPFERQAMIKLRHVAGDPVLGRQVDAHRDAYVYSGAPWDLPAALDLRRQQIKQLVEPGRINVKYSPGGLIDIEYAVQYLQLMHGHIHPTLRTPNTMQALTALLEAGFVPRNAGEGLRKAYLFIRMVIDGLRMVRGNARDLVLPEPESEDFVFLARRVGYATDDWEAGARHFQADLERHRQATQAFFTQKFGKL